MSHCYLDAKNLEANSLSFSNSAASALAGNTFLRSLAGAGFPLFATQMFDNLGIEWASTLLGCLAALLIPIPIAFYRWGHLLRARSKFAPTFPPQGAIAGASNDDEAATVAGTEKTHLSNEPNGGIPRKDEGAAGNSV